MRDLDPTRAGAGVEMHQGSDLVGSTYDFVDGLDRSDLVVREPDRNQSCVSGDCVRIRSSGSVDLGDGHPVAFSLKTAGGSED